MKKIAILVTLLIAVAFIGTAMATPKGKSTIYENKFGKVEFSSDAHGAAAGLKCTDCHPKMFPMKKDSTNMPTPHKIGESCGVCHDGERAFSQKKDCKACHKKE